MIYLRLQTNERTDEDGGSYKRWRTGSYIKSIEYCLDGTTIKSSLVNVTDDLDAAIRSGATIRCYDAQDVRQAFKSIGLDTPVDQYQCLEVVLSTAGLPHDVASAAYQLLDTKAVGLELEMMLWKETEPVALPDHEWNNYHNAMRVNERGLPVDVVFARKARSKAREHDADVRSAIRRKTGIQNTGSASDVKNWLERKGIVIKSMSRESLIQALKETDKADVKQVLRLREEIMMTGFYKFDALLNAEVDGRIKGSLKFAGAGRTWRFSGAGTGYQPQNISRPTLDVEECRQAINECSMDEIRSLYPAVSDVFASVGRSCINAPTGKKLVSVDYKSIEVSVISAITGCHALLQILKNNADPYKTFAAQMSNIRMSEVSPELRQYFKPVVLAGGFGQSADGLVKYAAKMGIEMLKESAQAQIDFYRTMCKEVVDAWLAFESAAKYVVKNRHFRKVGHNDCISFEMAGKWLKMNLPSGRSVNFFHPEIVDNKLTFFGLNSTTRKFERMTLWGAWLVQIATQAIARDLLVHGLGRVDKMEGVELIGSVHDELLALVNENDVELRPGAIAFIACMIPEWSTRNNLDLYVSSSTEIGDYYQ